jgi:hypothetical protein
MQPQPKLNKVEILQIVRQIILEMRVMHRVLERSEERADSVRQYLRALESTLAAECRAVLPGLGTVVPPLVPKTVSRRRIGESWAELKKLAEAGVARLDIQWLSKRSARVQVDDMKAFTLSLTLARLLEILAQDDAHTDGALVRWKSYDEVANALEKQVGRHFKKHAIKQLVYRLRRTLVGSGGLNPFLVQSDREFGLRFALRREEQV